MLRITLQATPSQCRIELEGRLAGVWVCELEHSWRTTRANQPHSPISVDLTGVTFIDQAGRYLLQLMHRDNVSFVASSLMLQDIFEQITGASD